jgi:hypothetical protein
VPDILVSDVEHWLDVLFVAAEGAVLRQEDRRKAIEVAAMLREIDREVRRMGGRDPIALVDAAAGKAYVGLLAAKLVLEPLGRQARVVTLERDASRAAASRAALLRLGSSVPVDCRTADVADPRSWPDRPSLVVALHACGPAADAVIEGALKSLARVLLLAPCCTSRAMPVAACAETSAERLGIPRHAPVRRRFVQAMVDADRTWRLEAAGYQTEVVEWVPATVTPHNLLWRARHVSEAGRMAAAARARATLRLGLAMRDNGTCEAIPSGGSVVE